MRETVVPKFQIFGPNRLRDMESKKVLTENWKKLKSGTFKSKNFTIWWKVKIFQLNLGTLELLVYSNSIHKITFNFWLKTFSIQFL